MKTRLFLPFGQIERDKRRADLKALSMLSNPSRKEIWKMFDRISPSYDRTNRIVSFGMDRRWRRKVADFLPLRKHLRILDLATGTGDQAIALLESKASIHSITGIDLSEQMLEIGRKKGKDKIEFLKGDAENLPFKRDSFHAATFSFGIRNVGNPLRSLQETHRVLKPKGKILILEFSLPPQPIRSFFLIYLRYLLPFIGGVISGNRSAYRYLNETIEHFPSGADFCKLLKEAGFIKLHQIPMNLGSVSLYIGEKE